jgi:hypothetical protein
MQFTFEAGPRQDLSKATHFAQEIDSAQPSDATVGRDLFVEIEERCTALRSFNEATTISCDSHYQLANRVAFTWKLATLGIPRVLVYLGFTGDHGIRDAGEPFRDKAHWRQVFSDYAGAVVPADLFERRLDCGAAPAWFLARSRPVLSLSPPTDNSRIVSRSNQMTCRPR